MNGEDAPNSKSYSLYSNCNDDRFPFTLKLLGAFT